MKIKLVIMLLFSLSMFIQIVAHGDEDHENKDTLTIVGDDTIAVNGVLLDSLNDSERDSVMAEEEHDTFTLDFPHELFEHMHNKLIHFPIAFLVAAFLFTLIGWKNDKYNSAITLLVFLAAVFAIVAYFTGSAQAEVFEHGPKSWLVETHESFGITTLILSWLWFGALVIERFRKYAWIIGLLAFIIVLITGFYGGVLAH